MGTTSGITIVDPHVLAFIRNLLHTIYVMIIIVFAGISISISITFTVAASVFSLVCNLTANRIEGEDNENNPNNRSTDADAAGTMGTTSGITIVDPHVLAFIRNLLHTIYVMIIIVFAGISISISITFTVIITLAAGVFSLVRSLANDLKKNEDARAARIKKENKKKKN